MNTKIERLNDNYANELSTILLMEAKNPIFKSVTITNVSVTNDLSYAKVYFTCFDLDKKMVQKELNDSKAYFRKLLADRIEVRHTPELNFVYDESIDYGKKIEDIIEKIHEEDGTKPMDESELNNEETKEETESEFTEDYEETE